MKNSGFTLVELLAVIVILAVLALIATPVVLSIIDDAKESAMLRSAEMYLSGVENAVMRENMNSGGNFRPNECSISNGNMICGSTNVEVEVDGEVPSTGSITFENGKITEVTLNYESGTIVKDASGNLVYEERENASICTLASDSTVEAGLEGAKYNCKVDPNKPEYTFYLLDNNEDGKSDLIMNQNINSDGTPAGMIGVTKATNALQYNLVAWVSDSDYGCEETNCATGDKGPITAMKFLYNVTKSWTNVPPLDYSKYDEGYQSFISTEGIATIGGTTIGTPENPLRARMPIQDSIEMPVTDLYDQSVFVTYLHDNLNVSNPSAPYGYWGLSSTHDGIDYSGTSFCTFAGCLFLRNVYDDSNFGVRPVITLKL